MSFSVKNQCVQNVGLYNAKARYKLTFVRCIFTWLHRVWVPQVPVDTSWFPCVSHHTNWEMTSTHIVSSSNKQTKNGKPKIKVIQLVLLLLLILMTREFTWQRVSKVLLEYSFHDDNKKGKTPLLLRPVRSNSLNGIQSQSSSRDDLLTRAIKKWPPHLPDRTHGVLSIVLSTEMGVLRLSSGVGHHYWFYRGLERFTRDPRFSYLFVTRFTTTSTLSSSVPRPTPEWWRFRGAGGGFSSVVRGKRTRFVSSAVLENGDSVCVRQSWRLSGLRTVYSFTLFRHGSRSLKSVSH